MPSEYVKSGTDAKDSEAVKVGPRGGMRYSTNKVNIRKRRNVSIGKDLHPPTYKIEGPGVEMAFFRTGGGFTCKYNGPYTEEAVSIAKEMLSSKMYDFKEVIDFLCKEFNCRIVNEDESN